MLSEKAKNLKTSPTLFLVAKAKDLAAKGHDVISLTVGEPDWPTFSVAAEAGIEAIKKGLTKYTAANGTLELRKAIAENFKRDLGQEYSVNSILVGPGAKFVIFSALQMICNPGDEVITPAPYWVSYPTMIELSGGVPKIIFCDEKTNFKLTPELLEKNISLRTKGFLFSSPSNPTGLMYTKKELVALAEVLRRHPQVVILSDDIYNRLVFDGTSVAPHLLHVAPDLKERTLCINGGSKAYAMTGWRIGWAGGPEKLIKAMGDYQSQATGSPSSISQQAALAAIPSCEGEIRQVVETLIRRKNAAIAELQRISEFKISQPDGAFYLWVDVRPALNRRYKDTLISDDKIFCDILLDDFFVATVPGLESGMPGYMRLSFATSEEKMRAAVQRMQNFIGALK